MLELRHIHGWFHLGVCLGIPRSILDQIHVSYGASLDAMGQCKIQLLFTWRDGSSGCINEEEGYLLPTIARKITCRRFN